jgi:hypothetical protein
MFNMRTSYSVAQKTGAIASGISAMWVYIMGIQMAWGQLSQAHDWVDGLLRMTLPVILSSPGVVLFVLSVQLMRREPTRDRIKNTLGVSAGFAALFIAALLMWLIELCSDESEHDVIFGVVLFVSVAVILPTYARVARSVLRASKIVPVEGEFVGQGCYMLLAFLLWAILSPIGITLSDAYQTDSLLDMGFFFVSFIIPYVLYRLAVKYLVRDTIDEQVASDYQSVHQKPEE